MRRLVMVVVVFVGLLATASASADVNRWGAFGANAFGLESSPTPIGLPAEAGSIAKIVAGNSASYAISTNGSLWSLGKNAHGQLGDETKEKSLAPVQVSFPAGTKVVSVGAGNSTAFAVDSSGQAWAWGHAQRENGNEEEGTPAQSLCLGGQERDVLAPVPVPGLSGVRAVAAAGSHIVWLMDNGTVETCGANGEGQLGNGNTEVARSNTPVSVPGLSSVVAISAGQATGCALTSKGEVFVWGADANGQVGNGKEIESGVFLPYHVPLPGKATQISCGGNTPENGSAIAIVGGVLYGWGDDQAGQLGDGQENNKLSPVRAIETTSLNLTQVAVSGEYTLGVNGAGEVYGWGSNANFALGVPHRYRVSMMPRLIDTKAVEVAGTAFDSLDR